MMGRRRGFAPFLLGCFGVLGGGVCGKVRVHLLSMLMLREGRLRGWGGGWGCVNVRVHLLSMCILRKGRLRGWGWGWGGVCMC